MKEGDAVEIKAAKGKIEVRGAEQIPSLEAIS
jgi:hypothetical protein